jgi:hypothetical protein
MWRGGLLSTTMPVLTVQYNLHPPADTPAPAIASSTTHEFPVPGADDPIAYYASLRAAIAEAKDKLGGELTVWRDAVGKRELAKEAAAPPKADDGSDEEEEEEAADV